MATKKHSKTSRSTVLKGSKTKTATPKPPAAYTPEELQRIGLRYVEIMASKPPPAPQSNRAKPTDSAHLRGADWLRATSTVDDIHHAARSMHQLALRGIDAGADDSETYFLAIENISKVVALKSEVLSSLLENGPAYGSFAEEFNHGRPKFASPQLGENNGR